MAREQRDSVLSIDALRGAAALLVAYLHGREVSWIGIRQYWHLHHATLSFDSVLALLVSPVMFGSIGVPVFFVLSGYCIHRSTAQKLARNPDYRIDARAFWMRRLIRIYPVLLCALVLTFVFDSASSHFAPHNPKLGDLGLHSFLVNTFALQGIAGPDYGSNGALWTLSMEIQFYLFYPLLLLVRRRLGLNRTLAALVVLNVLSYVFLERNGISVFMTYYVNWFIGAYLAELEATRTGPARSAKLQVLAGGLLVTGCAIFLANQFFAFQVWAAAFTLYLWHLLGRPYRPNWLVNRLAWVGGFSYSLYAIHLPIIIWLMSWQYDAVKRDSIVLSLLFLGVAMVLAYGFHLIVERPSLTVLAAMRSRPRVLTPAQA